MESYSLDEAAAAIKKTRRVLVSAIKNGALTPTRRINWKEPRITHSALVQFCIAFGLVCPKFSNR